MPLPEGRGYEKGFHRLRRLVNHFFPLKGEVSNHKGIFDEQTVLDAIERFRAMPVLDAISEFCAMPLRLQERFAQTLQQSTDLSRFQAEQMELDAILRFRERAEQAS